MGPGSSLIFSTDSLGKCWGGFSAQLPSQREEQQPSPSLQILLRSFIHSSLPGTKKGWQEGADQYLSWLALFMLPSSTQTWLFCSTKPMKPTLNLLYLLWISSHSRKLWHHKVSNATRDGTFAKVTFFQNLFESTITSFQICWSDCPERKEVQSPSSGFVTLCWEMPSELLHWSEPFHAVKWKLWLFTSILDVSWNAVDWASCVVLSGIKYNVFQTTEKKNSYNANDLFPHIHMCKHR